MPAIRVNNGPQRGSIFDIEDIGIVIGKSDDCDIQLFDHRVDSIHARIYRMGEMYFIRNLSEDGLTLVNDEPITEELLREGDQIKVGSTVLVFDSSKTTLRSVEESDYILSDFVFDIGDKDVLNPSMDVPDGGTRISRDMKMIREFLEIGVEQVSAKTYLDRTVDFINAKIECDLSAVVLKHADRNTFEIASVSKRPKSTTSIADAIVKYSLKRRKPLLIADAIGDQRFLHQPSVQDNDVHSVVCIPMVVRHEGIGCLYLAFDESNGVFSHDDFNLAKVLGMSIGSVLDNLQAFEKQNTMVISVVKALSKAVDLHDPLMMGHSERVGILSRSIADFLEFSPEESNNVYLAGLLHDIGRIGQNDDIVETQRAINNGIVKPIVEHVELGVNILSGIIGFGVLIPMVEAHHEFWDGTGLPYGLKGEKIPLGGRILCAANVLDEFLHPIVPESAPMQISEALKSLKLCARTKLDPQIVNAILIAYRKGDLKLD